MNWRASRLARHLQCPGWRCARRAYSTNKGALDFDSTLPLPNRHVNDLEKLLVNSIKATGPLQVARYMQMCLSHPTDGYYMKGDVFGSRGDFVTSPEISQVFGELVAIWFMTRWINDGSPSSIRVVELGPGRGTLMEDMIRSFSHFKACRDAIKSIHLVETSYALRKAQENRLQSAESTADRPIKLQWHDRLEDIPQDSVYTMVVAHEFFDALPIHILQKTETDFREVLVGTQDAAPASLPPLRFVLSDAPTPTAQLLSASSARFAHLPVGSRLEVSPASWSTARALGEIIKDGGSALVIDYGDDRVFGSSFRAFRKHKIVDVFDRPGESDLTANVDFAYLREAIAPVARAVGPIPQSDFLYKLGLEPRVQALVKAASSEKREAEITQAARRLVDKSGMGSQYKVLGVVPKPAKIESQELVGDIYPFP